MPDFYLDVTPETPLSQGDIFLDFPAVVPILEVRHYVISEGGGLYRAEPTGGLQAGMNLLATVDEVSPAIILTQSCDIRGVERLLLAPLREFRPKDPQPAKLWPQINDLANTLCQPTLIYLPDDPRFDFPRMQVDLVSPIVARREDVERAARNGKRRAALGPDGLGYFQFRLALLFSRFARDDFAWPSQQDLAVKKAYLEKRIENRKKRIATAKGRIASAKSSAEDVADAQADLEDNSARLGEEEEQFRLTALALDGHEREKGSPKAAGPSA